VRRGGFTSPNVLLPPPPYRSSTVSFVFPIVRPSYGIRTLACALLFDSDSDRASTVPTFENLLLPPCRKPLPLSKHELPQDDDEKKRTATTAATWQRADIPRFHTDRARHLYRSPARKQTSEKAARHGVQAQTLTLLPSESRNPSSSGHRSTATRGRVDPAAKSSRRFRS
jgi:hypothetical protein